jgi:protein-tyrosine phosphatase
LLPSAIELPDGCWVRGRGLRAPLVEDLTPQFGLYLGTDRLRRRHQPHLRWAQDWIAWPDFLVPLHPDEATRAIVDLHRRAQQRQRVEVACGGGVGRTGTVIACLAVLAGIPAAEAVGWTRAHYRPRAVETPWQRRWVHAFARRRADTP